MEKVVVILCVESEAVVEVEGPVFAVARCQVLRTEPLECLKDAVLACQNQPVPVDNDGLACSVP